MKMTEEKKKKINFIVCMSDFHLGDENCLYKTLDYTIDKLVSEIHMLKTRYEINKTVLIVNGDVSTGTFIFRNQYLQTHVDKNEDIILFCSYVMHKIIERIEKAVGMKVKTFMVVGNHEAGRSPLPHNFTVSISRRLHSYGNAVRYTSQYCIVDISSGLDAPKYNVLAFHGWGGADYSSASPSIVREMTRTQSQFSVHKNIIIHRFLVGHTHWLEVNRSALGIRWDVAGGFQRWDKTPSFRECGLLYYTYDEDGEFDVRPVSGLKMQIVESADQGLHVKNMKYVAEMMEEAINYELDLGILKRQENGETR